tara:strand:+ start:880 stop:1266 length:387 start_codon:yes stop_codon:yes gene_type:complete
MKICIIGMDFAVVEARVLAMALDHGIEVECIPEEDLHSHEDIQVVLVSEYTKEAFNTIYGSSPAKIRDQFAKRHDEQVVISMGGRQMGRSASYKALYGGGCTPEHRIELTAPKVEPHWVTRNAKNKRY